MDLIASVFDMLTHTASLLVLPTYTVGMSHALSRIDAPFSRAISNIASRVYSLTSGLIEKAFDAVETETFASFDIFERVNITATLLQY